MLGEILGALGGSGGPGIVVGLIADEAVLKKRCLVTPRIVDRGLQFVLLKP